MIWRGHNAILLGVFILGLAISLSLSDPTAVLWALGIIAIIKIIILF